MGRSFSNITVHIIFHCKNGACLIKEDDLPEVFHYIGGIIRAESGYAYIVGGRPDHIHILTSVPVKTSLADFVRAIKANTSRWVKGLHADYQHFSWQEGYGAFSVSASKQHDVIHYIQNQKEHHRVCSAQEEFMRFLVKNGLMPDVKST